jgi:hypothetical protein
VVAMLRMFLAVATSVFVIARDYAPSSFGSTVSRLQRVEMKCLRRLTHAQGHRR